MAQIARPRLAGLDILRALAVLLVLGRHAGWNPSAPSALMAWQLGGWMGVDLFFVLSGFLVSGLLFSEYQKHRSVSIARFLVRRGLKIYPAFYVFLALTWAVAAFHWRVPVLRTSEVVSDLFFIQSYVPSAWPHTWSLAVEEHFYLFCAGLIFLLTRIGRGKGNPYRAIPWVFAIVAALALAARVATSRAAPFDVQTHLFATHLRLDGLMFGVFLSYLWHFKREELGRLIRGREPFLAVIAVAMFTPAFVFPLDTTRLLTTAGLTVLWVGSGALVLSVVSADLPDLAVLRWLSTVGRYSYSIYLWHYFVKWEVEFLCRTQIDLEPGSPGAVLLYMGASIAVGVLMSKIVEYPVLRLRDRLFPPPAEAIETPQSRPASDAVTLDASSAGVR